MIQLGLEYIKMSTPYLERGLTYFAIVGILLAIWILLRYKNFDLWE